MAPVAVRGVIKLIPYRLGQVKEPHMHIEYRLMTYLGKLIAKI